MPLTPPAQDLAQIVGTDDARKIYDKVALLRAAPPPASPRFAPYHAGSDATDEPYERRSGEAYAERPVKREEDEGGVEADAEAEANEVYILALATALQRAPDAEPCRVEVRVRQALKQLGMCLETCRAYFLLSQRGKDSGRLD